MTEKELINKIKHLKEIKPDSNWVLLAKNKILESDKFASVNILEKSHIVNNPIYYLSFIKTFFFKKPAYVGVFIFLVLFGIFGSTQNSLPGDFFYPLKKNIEKMTVVLAPEEEKTAKSLDLTTKRLEELNKIVKDNQKDRLQFAVQELNSSASQAADLISTSSKDSLSKVVDIAKKSQELKSAGIMVEGEGLKKLELASTKVVLQDLIKDLENRTLTLKQEMLLDKMKEYLQEGKYSEALELYLINQY
jgi:hypothetical protein